MPPGTEPPPMAIEDGSAEQAATRSDSEVEEPGVNQRTVVTDGAGDHGQVGEAVGNTPCSERITIGVEFTIMSCMESAFSIR